MYQSGWNRQSNIDVIHCWFLIRYLYISICTSRLTSEKKLFSIAQVKRQQEFKSAFNFFRGTADLAIILQQQSLEAKRLRKQMQGGKRNLNESQKSLETCSNQHSRLAKTLQTLKLFS